jgi:methylated-DNA-protein-cysteine methyltransferase-like protein
VVGWALNSGIVDPTLPAHRVVNAAGLLTGKIHFHPPEAMQLRLEQEGIEIKADKVINFAEKFWDPSLELELFS